MCMCMCKTERGARHRGASVCGHARVLPRPLLGPSSWDLWDPLATRAQGRAALQVDRVAARDSGTHGPRRAQRLVAVVGEGAAVDVEAGEHGGDRGEELEHDLGA